MTKRVRCSIGDGYPSLKKRSIHSPISVIADELFYNIMSFLSSCNSRLKKPLFFVSKRWNKKFSLAKLLPSPSDHCADIFDNTVSMSMLLWSQSLGFMPFGCERLESSDSDKESDNYVEDLHSFVEGHCSLSSLPSKDCCVPAVTASIINGKIDVIEFLLSSSLRVRVHNEIFYMMARCPAAVESIYTSFPDDEISSRWDLKFYVSAKMGRWDLIEMLMDLVKKYRVPYDYRSDPLILLHSVLYGHHDVTRLLIEAGFSTSEEGMCECYLTRIAAEREYNNLPDGHLYPLELKMYQVLRDYGFEYDEKSFAFAFSHCSDRYYDFNQGVPVEDKSMEYVRFLQWIIDDGCPVVMEDVKHFLHIGADFDLLNDEFVLLLHLDGNDGDVDV